MTDRELLELAAKAAGLSGLGTWDDKWGCLTDYEGWTFDPLNDDGDALRLAAALGLVVDCSRPSAGRPFYSHEFRELDATSTIEGVRRAIVRAAAEIGRQM